ncbi:hypothetical protein EJB05_38178 [Eragrostis curvula]|uniref:CBS domain-containing protein n=1 Tax=Eragrostis curvula TaxID=38414 RepID=A0A5J9TTL7_9POAL|nr:hypothetical protein EJB05_51342 [Eragrostis curvula]TVU14694.1 hypothetical protein EJB05_38178 [Eragrostis curvula]
MVLRRFSWPYGGRQASFSGSFTGWREYPMALVGAEFQVVFDLSPGVYQYRFLIDGVWRCDETKPCVRDEYGLISNEVLVENNAHPVVQPEPSSGRGINMDDGTILTTMPSESSPQNPGVQLAVFRHRISEILLHSTIYDVVPVSSKLAVLDAQLPVKQAFKIMHDELQRNIRALGHEELEMHPISSWKEAKLQFYVALDGAAMQRRPLIHVKDSDNLVDVALTIIRNEISSVPIFKTLPDSSGMPLLNLATLPGILKYRVSSIPIVDKNGSFHDVYSLSDIMALAKNDVYARIELEQVTVQNALDVQYQVNGRRQSHTCLQTSTLLEVLDELSIPGVRRLVVIEPSTRFVEGVISLRDVFTFLLG